MADYSNLSFNTAPTLPPPSQIGGDISVQTGTTATSAPTGNKTVGGSSSGVNASKGALTATGVNSLVVDPKVQSAMSTSGLSGLGMDAESVLGAAPAGMAPGAMITSLGNVVSDLDQISNITNTFASDVSGQLGAGSSEGKIKGGRDTGGAKKGEKGEKEEKAKGEGKGKVKGKRPEGRSAPNASSSVSREESSTGATITTMTSETVSSSGAVTNNTATTISGGGVPSVKEDSGSGSSTGSTEPPPPPDDTDDLSSIMNELGMLTNQQSATMAQQQASMIDAISLQASDTNTQAAAMVKGADMMMTMAVTGLAVSMLSTAYSMGSVGEASEAGDSAETEAMSQQELTMTRTSDSSLTETEKATNPASFTKQSTAEAQAKINETKQSSSQHVSGGTMTKEQAASIHQQAELSQKSLNNAQYYPNGTKLPGPYEGSAEHVQANADAKAALKGPINTPEQATAFYNREARTLHDTRTGDSTTSIANLSKQGIKPGAHISQDKAEEAIKSNWSDADKEKYAEAHKKGEAGTQDEMLQKPAETFKANVAKMQVNKNSQAWTGAYQNRMQQHQIYAGGAMAVSQVFNSAGNMEDQINQAQATRDSAAAQVQGATEQSLSAGLSNTEAVAGEIRSNLQAVAQDMSSMVSSTRA
ncbi:MAG: hypothetical protein NT164_08095 [Verrucomicrobiae bacterium]|nr:hypothetical protein [Verrucomicrobiae bacterium]